MKISEILKNTACRLKNAGIDTASLDAKLLLCKYLNSDKLFLIVNSEMDIKIDDSYEDLVSRRERHEPMQYILGKTEFYGLEFRVDKSVLIPRTDTEVLVEKAVDFIGENPYTVLDIGTGSGCIPITIAVNCKNAKVHTVDISQEALKIAFENARINNVESKVNFLNIDILKDFPEFEVDCIVSNPPYIENYVIPTLMRDVKDYEPRIALDGGSDGLTFYRRIAEKGYDILKKGGLITFEVGYNQAEQVAEILISNNFEKTGFIKDLAGIDRVVFATRN